LPLILADANPANTNTSPSMTQPTLDVKDLTKLNVLFRFATVYLRDLDLDLTSPRYRPDRQLRQQPINRVLRTCRAEVCRDTGTPKARLCFFTLVAGHRNRCQRPPQPPQPTKQVQSWRVVFGHLQEQERDLRAHDLFDQRPFGPAVENGPAVPKHAPAQPGEHLIVEFHDDDIG